jgi:hypothetical protein
MLYVIKNLDNGKYVARKGLECATTIIVAGRRQLGWPIISRDRSRAAARWR